jgi:hypothetical protein
VYEGPTTLGRDWALPYLILNQYNNKIPKVINTITNYRKSIPATYTRTKTRHKHRDICCLLSLVKTCLIHYSIILNLTTVNVPRIENIIFFNLQKKTVAFRCVLYLVVPQTGNQSCVQIHPFITYSVLKKQYNIQTRKKFKRCSIQFYAVF